MEYTIYKLTNKITGLSYVGQTNNLENRLYHHKRCSGGCRYLHNAIKKYGWDNFECIVLEVCDELSVNKIEGKHIVLENTLCPSGYNLTIDTDVSRDFSEETLELKSHSSQKRIRNDTNKITNLVGVTYKENCKSKYVCHITYKQKSYTKSYDNPIEAAESYDRLAIHFHGPSARINFIDSLKTYLSEDLKEFFDKFIEKREETSKYSCVCFHKRHKKWTSYWKLPNGKYKSFGIHDTEEQAYEVQQEFIKTGKYTKTKPSDWNYPTKEKKVVTNSYFIYTVISPINEKFKTVSLRYMEDDLKLGNGCLTNSVKYKRPSKSGWNVIDKIDATDDNIKEFIDGEKYIIYKKYEK
jgi:group I intron endonuclease